MLVWATIGWTRNHSLVMQSAPQKPEVVYRRTPANSPTASLESTRRGIAPAIIFLITGFLLLLGLISAVGYKSVQLMSSISFRSREITVQRSARLNLLWDLRLRVTRL